MLKYSIVLLHLVFNQLSLLPYEPPHDKTNKMTVRPAKTQISLGIQNDQGLRCPHEESLGPELPTERTAKTMMRLGGCPG